MLVATSAAAQSPDTSLSGNFLPALLETSAPHRDSLTALIKGKPGLPGWVRSIIKRPRYVALASEAVEIGDRRLQLFRACEAGKCEASGITVLFSADGKRAVLRVSDLKLGITVYGEASEDELKVLSQ